MQNIPLFGGSADKISPTEPTLTSGFLPLQLLPAENLNYYLNAATQAIQEWVHLITLAGLSPSTSQQGWTAISGLMSAGFNFTLSPIVPTQSSGDGSTKVASTAFVQRYLRADTAIQGLLLSNDSGTPNTIIDIAAGAAVDTTFVDMLLLSSAYTKTTGAWAVGTGNGGLDTGSVAVSTWYYVYIIKRIDTGVVDILLSASPTAPTMPTNYTLRRMIGAIKTNASSQLIAFIQYRDGTQAWTTLTSDIADGTLTTSKKTYTVASVPNVQQRVWVNYLVNHASAAVVDFYGDTNLTDTAPQSSGPVVAAGAAAAAFNSTEKATIILTGNSIFARSTASSTTLNLSVTAFNIRPFN
jgi:hypothetical protein